MIELHALDWYEIKNRGLVAIVDGHLLPKEKPIKTGDSILIDGTQYECIGIETFCLLNANPGGFHNLPQGILVKSVVPSPRGLATHCK